jgi:ABC-2 type transport system ATP-binding protein
MSTAAAIEVMNLGKVYDSVDAVKNLSLTVQHGEIFGLLGPNGAGKSTTLRILITTLSPTTGTATILGHDVVKEADTVRRLIGYVAQERAIDRFLTGREHLLLFAKLYHLPKQEALIRIDSLLKLVGLEEDADRVAKGYSGGMKRKLDIACGLLPHPKILFLDEPTLGLDVQSRLNIWEHIRQLKQQGITIVMTTNYLDEADQLCDRIAIIDRGEIRVTGSPKDLKASLGGDGIWLTLIDATPEILEQLTTALQGLPFVRAIRPRESGLDIRVDGPEKALPAIMETTNTIAGCRLDGIEYHRPRLDDVFVTHTGRSLKDEPPAPAAVA